MGLAERRGIEKIAHGILGIHQQALAAAARPNGWQYQLSESVQGRVMSGCTLMSGSTLVGLLSCQRE